MCGRQFLVAALLGKTADNSPLHLLGCSLPQEFINYSCPAANKSIVSIDTSNPVVHGLYRVKYTKDGLERKLSTKLVDLLYEIPDKEQTEIIEYNCKMFRKFVNG